MSSLRHSRIRRLVTRLENFSRFGIGIPLRPYQQEVADAVVRSILGRLGLSFVVIFPRQSGKNETQAHIEAYLLCLLSGQDIEIVSVSPTYKPQALTAMLRLQRCLDSNPFTCGRWHTQAGFTVRLDRACVHFFSGNSVAHTVGATASALLSVDEAQDIRPSTYDRKFAPMVASTNATRVSWGTPWSSSTLLAREKRRAEFDQEKDGVRRLWTLTADDVTLVHPVYGEFVSGEVGRYGRTHPYIKTQYFSEELDSQGSMFNPSRLLLMQGDESPSLNPQDLGRAGVGLGEMAEGQRGWAGRGVAFLLDVAGQDESRMQGSPGSSTGDFGSEDAPLENPARDSASLSIASIDLSTLSTLKAPTYRILHRRQWTGCNHVTLFGQLESLAGSWRPEYIVIDATGVGEGLWALLDKAFPSRVIPVKFNRQVKSELGWKFLSIIDTGRFRNCARTATSGSSAPRLPHEGQTPTYGILPAGDQVRLQYVSCLSEVLPGPGKNLRWGVPEGARGPDGQLIHDDFLLADSLVGILDSLEWYSPNDLVIIPGFDPLSRCEGFQSHVRFSP
jgi:hypothetical protein